MTITGGPGTNLYLKFCYVCFAFLNDFKVCSITINAMMMTYDDDDELNVATYKARVKVQLIASLISLISKDNDAIGQ